MTVRPKSNRRLNRLAAILLLLAFAAVGTGGMGYVHDRQHAAEDAAEDAADRAVGVPVERHHHDESNCALHAQLHLLLVAGGWAPAVAAATLVAVTPPACRQPSVCRPAPARADCRDPPPVRPA